MLKFILGVFIGSVIGMTTIILAMAAKQADKELENIPIRKDNDNDKTSV